MSQFNELTGPDRHGNYTSSDGKEWAYCGRDDAIGSDDKSHEIELYREVARIDGNKEIEDQRGYWIIVTMGNKQLFNGTVEIGRTSIELTNGVKLLLPWNEK